MNIFVTNECPIKSARYLDDKRVVKMVLESAQLLCSVFHEVEINGGLITESDIPYKVSHANHACSKWARHSWHNFDWILRHGFALSTEYTNRYGKIHKCLDVLKWCRHWSFTLCFENEGLKPFLNYAKNNIELLNIRMRETD